MATHYKYNFNCICCGVDTKISPNDSSYVMMNHIMVHHTIFLNNAGSIKTLASNVFCSECWESIGGNLIFDISKSNNMENFTYCPHNFTSDKLFEINCVVDGFSYSYQLCHSCTKKYFGERWYSRLRGDTHG